MNNVVELPKPAARRSGRASERTIDGWNEFQQAWDGLLNFRMAGECVPFSFDLPPISEIVRQVRDDEDVLISNGVKTDRADVMSDIREEFRGLPLEEAVFAPCQISHGGLRFHGELAPHERELEAWRRTQSKHAS